MTTASSPRPDAAPFGDPRVELRGLIDAWRARVGGSQARAAAALAVVSFFTALLAGRHGTAPWRASAAVAMAALLGGLLWAWSRERAIALDAARLIERMAAPVDADTAGRAIRALTLLDGDGEDGTSAALASIHVRRSLRALPEDRILDRASRLAGRYAALTLALAAASLGLALTRGFAIYEGADVLFAVDHRGLLPIIWLDAVDVTAHPPDYLHTHDRWLAPYSSMAVPRGTVLTFRGRPLYSGRLLSLTDGHVDVPFADDGAGHVVARWTVGDSVTLTAVARFGDVVIREPHGTSVVSLADDLPVVTVEDAPRQVRLADVGVSASIPVRYEASDDHGLREVHLVLRSGTREERRRLARLDGDTRTSRGGQTLRASDPFLKKSHAPVLVTVEAEDNDTVTGPKWGASPAITVIPPEAGEPEALRMEVLRSLRDGFVDSLAGRMDRAFSLPAKGRQALVDDDQKSVAADASRLDDAAKASPAGLAISRRSLALLRGQMRRVKEAMTQESRSPGVASHGRLVAASERLVLVTDGVVRGVAQRDARKVARALADVADDLVLGASQMRSAGDRERGEARADASVTVLEGGSRSLLRLGALGRDLGEIVHVDLLRVARARDQDDTVHAEIAASDLATRLRDPDPSFGSSGGSGGSAGGESGGSRGTPGEGEPDDDVEGAFNDAANQVAQLSRDHASEIGKVEDVMNEGDTPDESEEARAEEKSHAQSVRDAAKGLPSVGAGSDSWTNKGAAARESAEAMARALEDGKAADAVASGRSALDALEEAKHIAQRERWTSLFSTADPDIDRSNAERRIEAARQKLEPELAWATNKMNEMKKRVSEAKAGELAGHGEQEDKLADRAEDLHQGGEGREDSARSEALPAGALEALHQAAMAAREAASALKRGDAEQGLAQQREAQRRLEAAEEAMGSEPADGEGEGGEARPRSGEGQSTRAGGHAEIPDANAHQGPADFRRRVIEGLGQGGTSRQREAIRRYADGLLR